ncbi:XRE family transcriptional regulator [Hymenobacter aquaticus]|uniref:XRE family transcriptional regulator n=1 Tax=Hymenobacter aquaticus TaxID=1867101 RepID=A0A4Z0Q6E0_9BACT|nr:helix-turn-helix transcriptional regulator [Hymenobacter aquaticus]TGE25657.1 XRE family transcriptional regulator [Hymenobacter aquaticus]
MARRSRSSTNVLVRLRTWFGLDQEALALYLGVSPGLIRSIETGRRALTADIFLALRPLVLHLPPPEAPAPVPAEGPPPGLPAPEAEELAFRRQVCAVQLAKLGRELAAIEARARVAARWAQALPALRQAAIEAHAIPDPDNPDRGSWLLGWLERQARPLPAQDATRWHLLRARLAALRAEVAALDDSAGGVSYV